MEHQVAHPDLQATVYPFGVPAGLAAELPQLYETLYSTEDWFLIHDHAEAQGACVLSEPRHILLFTISDGTIEILNKACVIAAADVERACRALFRTIPKARRLHVEAAFSPQALRLPKRILSSSEHDFIPLPASPEEYLASLSVKVRREIRRRISLLHADFSSVQTEVIEGPAAAEYFPLLARWKIDRFRSLGRSAVWETDSSQIEMCVELVRRSGRAHLTRVDGRPASIRFDFPVGNTICGFHHAFDPSLKRYGLGTLAVYWRVCDAIAEGARRVDLAWGGEPYKKKLGALSMTVTRVSVFPRQLDRLRSLSEAAGIGRRRLRRQTRTAYWRTRRFAGRIARRLGVKSDTPP